MGEETRATVRAIEMVERKDRVLIVEDEDNARKGYEQLLQRWGCDVVGVGTAEEALAKFASYQPDTLIADVELPGMNGLDLLRQLGPELYGVPAIIITGKEIVARTLHKLSPRANGPFVAINCSAIHETLMESEIFGHERGAFTGAAERRIGCFELADAGTLLLDEIGEMPAPTQAKLLRVLEDRTVRRLGSKRETRVDVRGVAATNKEAEQAVGTGQMS